MITLTILLCVAVSGECRNLSSEERYGSIAECEKAGEMLVAANADELSRIGVEVRGITCHLEAETPKG